VFARGWDPGETSELTVAEQGPHGLPRMAVAGVGVGVLGGWERVRGSTRAADLLSLAGLLAILVAASREWIFNNLRLIDAWIYVGFFRHYDFAPMLAYDKKIARLPWILLGYAVDHLTSPLAAQFILHLGLLAAGAAALYVVLARRYGRAVAFLVSAFYLTYVPAHGSGGWDYNTTPSGLLYVLGYAALLELTGQSDRARAKGFVAGLAGAVLIHTNLLFVLVVPALLLVAAARIRSRLAGPALRRWTREALLAAAGGALGLTLLLAIVNAIVGRAFFFFDGLIGLSAFLLAHPEDETAWWRPWSDSWCHEYHMPLIIIVLILIALTVVLSRISRTNVTRREKHDIAIFLISLGFFAVFQSIGHPLLEPAYMAFPLLLPTMFALAALARIALAPAGGVPLPEWKGPWSLAGAVTFAGLFVLQAAHPMRWHLGLLKHHDYILGLMPIVIGFLAVWAAMRIAKAPWPPAARGRLAGAVAAGLLVLVLAETNAEWPYVDRTAYSYRNGCHVRQAIFSLVVEADRMLFPRVRVASLPLAYRAGETISLGGCAVPIADVARPVSNLGYGLVMPYYGPTEALARLPDDVVDRVARKQSQMAIITRDDGFRDGLLGRLRERGPEWHIASDRPLGEGTDARLIVLSRSAATLAVSR
jgi:hypothetical protein